MNRLRIDKQNKNNERLHVPPGGVAKGTPYPDFDITNTDKWNLDWDEKTRQLVINRLKNVPPYRFFSPEEARLLEVPL